MKFYKSLDLDIFHLIILFTSYSFLGWIMEVLFAYHNHHHFVNRGFLTGPFCTIYGFGFILLFISLNKFKDKLPLLFIAAILITSALELFTGFFLDVFFHKRYWNYLSCPLNINGYICLYFSLLWGVLSLIILKVINPLVSFLISLIPNNLVFPLSFLMVFYFFNDLLISIEQLELIRLFFKKMYYLLSCIILNISYPISNYLYLNNKFNNSLLITFSRI